MPSRFCQQQICSDADTGFAVEIASADMPTGVAGATNIEYIPNHIVSSRTTLHKIYHDLRRPSHLLLPVIPRQ